MGLAQKLTDYNNPNSLGSRMRKRRFRHIIALIDSIHATKGAVKILDVGGRKLYWNPLSPEYLKSKNVSITILNLPCEGKPADEPHFSYQNGDACSMPHFADASFNLVHSNSVIEHVGGWDNIKRFASEVRRVGRSLYIQTPYFWFPIEPHYVCPLFHWLPWQMQLSLIKRFTLGNRGKGRDLEDSMRITEMVPKLLTKELYRHLFPDCTIKLEYFTILPKSMIAIRIS